MNTALDYYSSKGVYPFIVKYGDGSFLGRKIILLQSGNNLLGDSFQNDDIDEKFGTALESLYSSVKPITARHENNDYTFEVGYVPACAGQNEEPAKLRVTTYQSRLTGNYGNGFEAAADIVFDPSKSLAYIASMGMGISSALTNSEQRYFRKYGRLLYEDDGKTQALPVVHALARVLDSADIAVDSLYSDSSGAVFTLAYGAMYGAGTIKTAHQNVRPGLWDKNPLQLAKDMVFIEPRRSKKIAQKSPDLLRMRKEVIDFTTQHLGSTFAERQYHPKKSLAMMGSYAVGLGRGPSSGDPLVEDNIAFVRTNPDARVVFSFGRQDPLTSGGDLDARVDHIVYAVSAEGGKVTAAIVEDGSHSIQTHYPQFLRSLAKAALQ